MSTTEYQIDSLSDKCPERFTGFDKPVAAYRNVWSPTTMVGYLVLSECSQELGIRKMDSIDERPAGGGEQYMRGDLDANLNHLLLAILGKVRPMNGDTDLNYQFTLEIAPTPSKALQYLHEARKDTTSEKGHNWEPISEGITSSQVDTKINIVIATEHDSDDTRISETGGPHEALEGWKDRGLVSEEYVDRAISGEVGHIDILRWMGIPVVVLENYVDDVDRLKSLVEKEIARQIREGILVPDSDQ